MCKRDLKRDPKRDLDRDLKRVPKHDLPSVIFPSVILKIKKFKFSKSFKAKINTHTLPQNRVLSKLVQI